MELAFDTCQDRLVVGGPIFLTHKGFVIRTTLQNNQFISVSAILQRGTMRFQVSHERNKIDEGGRSRLGVATDPFSPLQKCPVSHFIPSCAQWYQDQP